jgi:hypothetical protein
MRVPVRRRRNTPARRTSIGPDARPSARVPRRCAATVHTCACRDHACVATRAAQAWRHIVTGEDGSGKHAPLLANGRQARVPSKRVRDRAATADVDRRRRERLRRAPTRLPHRAHRLVHDGDAWFAGALRSLARRSGDIDRRRTAKRASTGSTGSSSSPAGAEHAATPTTPTTHERMAPHGSPLLQVPFACCRPVSLG